MASYNNFDNNLKTDSTLLPIVNCGTSIFAGFVVFSVLGYLSGIIQIFNINLFLILLFLERTGIDIENVATG